MPSFQKLQVVADTKDFAAATKVVQIPEIPSPPADHVLVKTKYVGINAGELLPNGGYYSDLTMPYDCGMEGAGLVESVGDNVVSFHPGDAVTFQLRGAFAEYVLVPVTKLFKAPKLSPALLPIMLAGVSASIALEQVGQLVSNETVLVTAAAGASGQFAVQLAKIAGNHVIGTCSSRAKVEQLKSIGCDRVINYKEEDMNQVLQSEYPNGIDLVFEAVGGKMFKVAVQNLALKGRVLVFGQIASYKTMDTENAIVSPELMNILLPKSASVRAFFLYNYADCIERHMRELVDKTMAGELKPGTDPTVFQGIESIADAVELLNMGGNVGKVVVEL